MKKYSIIPSEDAGFLPGWISAVVMIAFVVLAVIADGIPL